MFALTTSGPGMCTAIIDVCKTPAPPSSPVPIPYPSIAQCSRAKGSTCSSKVKVKGKKVHTVGTVISRCQGAEPGTAKGLMSGTVLDEVQYKTGSQKVRVEGLPAVYATCKTAHNGTNANAPGGLQSAPCQPFVLCFG